VLGVPRDIRRYAREPLSAKRCLPRAEHVDLRTHLLVTGSSGFTVMHVMPVIFHVISTIPDRLGRP
jgi:hypothetical protein